MAVVKIYENQEIGATVSSSAFDLPVFMVGYSTRGPENENVYFSNYADFKRKFGNVPYRFKKPQYKDGAFWQAQGSYEKGFIYAHEYALLGKPGVFRRITKDKAAYCKMDTLYIEKRVMVYKATIETPTITETVTFSPIEGGYTSASELIDNSYWGRGDNGFSVAFGDETYSSEADDLESSNGVITLTTDDGIDNLVGTVTFTSKAEEIYLEYDGNDTYLYVDDYTGRITANFDESNNIRAKLPWTQDEETYSAFEIPKSEETGKYITIMASSSGAWAKDVTVTITDRKNGDYTITAELKDNGKVIEKDVIEKVNLLYGHEDFIAGDGERTTNLLKIVNGTYNEEGDIVGAIDSSEGDLRISGFDEGKLVGKLEYDGEPDDDEIAVDDIFDKLKVNEFWTELTDKDLNDYAVLTTGAYPMHDPTDEDSAAALQLRAASEYQLGFAVIDNRKRPNRTSMQAEVESLMSEEAAMPLSAMTAGSNSVGEKNGIYGAMFFDWHSYKTSFGRVELPPSFAYIKALASTGMGFNQIKPWEAMANDNAIVGVVDSEKLGGSISDQLQRYDDSYGIRVNPIQYLRNSGHRIMGNSTLANNEGLTNYSFLNIRVLTTIIKRYAYQLGNTLKYKTNSLNTFLTFQSKMTAFLNRFLDKGFRTEDNLGRRITPFGIDLLPSLERGQIRVHIWYYPLEAIEKVEEYITLKDGYVEVGG